MIGGKPSDMQSPPPELKGVPGGKKVLEGRFVKHLGGYKDRVLVITGAYKPIPDDDGGSFGPPHKYDRRSKT